MSPWWQDATDDVRRIVVNSWECLSGVHLRRQPLGLTQWHRTGRPGNIARSIKIQLFNVQWFGGGTEHLVWFVTLVVGVGNMSIHLESCHTSDTVSGEWPTYAKTPSIHYHIETAHTSYDAIRYAWSLESMRMPRKRTATKRKRTGYGSAVTERTVRHTQKPHPYTTTVKLRTRRLHDAIRYAWSDDKFRL